MLLQFLQKRWFLIGLLILIPGGLWLGVALSDAQHAAIVARVGRHTNALIVSAIMLLMAFGLNSRRLLEALTAPAPTLWAASVNLAVIPLLAWPLSRLQRTEDFSVGLMIAASVPCTMAAASVWTRKAGGNDAISLMTTLLTSSLCFVVTPAWLKLTTSATLARVGADIEIDVVQMMRQLALSALLPIAIGQALRIVPACAAFADRHKTPMGVVAQALILTIMFWASLRAGPNLRHNGGLPGEVLAVPVVWGSCIAIHVAGMFIALQGARGLGFSRRDATAVAFAGSQKTLPIGVLIATDPRMFGSGDLPFAVFPMLMFHASQLLLDTVIADRMAGGVKQDSGGMRIQDSGFREGTG